MGGRLGAGGKCRISMAGVGRTSVPASLALRPVVPPLELCLQSAVSAPRAIAAATARLRARRSFRRSGGFTSAVVPWTWTRKRLPATLISSPPSTMTGLPRGNSRCRSTRVSDTWPCGLLRKNMSRPSSDTQISAKAVSFKRQRTSPAGEKQRPGEPPATATQRRYGSASLASSSSARQSSIGSGGDVPMG